MDRVYVFAIRNDVWIYILCALGLLWFINEFIRGQSALRRAMFGLERETALRTRNTALFVIVILGTIAAFVAYVNISVRPTLPPELLRPPTPTVAPFSSTVEESTQTSTAAVATPTSPIAPTVTLPGDSGAPANLTPETTATSPVTAVPGESTPTAPAIAGCAPEAIISEPREDATVLGLLNLFGSASTEDFGYYEVEINGPQTNGRWASLLGRRVTQPVDNGILAGNVDLSGWAPGSYELRLTVANQAGNTTNQCRVSINLETQIQE